MSLFEIVIIIFSMFNIIFNHYIQIYEGKKNTIIVLVTQNYVPLYPEFVKNITNF